MRPAGGRRPVAAAAPVFVSGNVQVAKPSELPGSAWPRRTPRVCGPEPLERADADLVVQDAVRVGALVEDVEVQLVGLGDVLVLAAGVDAGVERAVVELALVARRRLLDGAVRRARSRPGRCPAGWSRCTRRSSCSEPQRRARGLRLADQDAVARGERVRADLLHDLHRVVVEAALTMLPVGDVRHGTLARRVDAGLALQADAVAVARAVEVHAHAREIAVRLDLARLDLGDGEAASGPGRRG